MSVAFDRIVDALDGRGLLRRESGGQREGLCPAHDDRRASLRVRDFGDNAGVYCHAGCSAEDVMGKLDLPLAALFDSHWSRNGNSREPLAVYSYTDEDGRPLFEVCRFDGKDFRQRKPSGEWGIKGVRRVLYRLPRVVEAASRGQRVFVAEGEKDVHAIERAGAVATCNPMGAGKWREEYAGSLRGAHVVVIADCDDAGRAHASEAVRSLSSIATSVEVREAKSGKDASDHFAAGNALRDFVEVQFSGAPAPVTTSSSAPVSGELGAITASTVRPESVRWLWQGWIPLGMLTLLAGLPGLGKTTLDIALAAAVTRGELDGALSREPAPVLIASLEDAIASTLVPRLMAAHAELDLVHFVECKASATGGLDLTRHLPEVDRLAREFAARFLIIDPLVATMPAGRISSHRDQDVRSVLAPLASLSERREIAVLANMHFSKSAIDSLLGVGGSIGFVGAARSVLIFGADPNDERGEEGPARVLAHRKCNVGRRMRSRQCSILSCWVDGWEDEKIETSEAILGDEVDVDADELVRVRDREVPPITLAIRFLRHALADGPMAAAEVYDVAEDEGIAKRTLDRAKRDLDVDSFQRDRKWWWLLSEPDDGSGDDG
jgi:putative DNA primase/helicase